jgi:hypothetical protein
VSELLLGAFVGEGPLILGLNETLERRYRKKIAARGIYRDPVRPTHETFAKSSGLRSVCVMLLVEVPWASRVWALPFLPALASCPGSFRALCRRAGQTPQEDNRVGLAAAPASKAMVSTTEDRGRGRSRPRIVRTARPLPQALRPGHIRQPLALRWVCERMSRIDGRKSTRRGGRWKKGRSLRARRRTGAR